MKTKYILTASTLILALASCTSEVEEAISGQKVPLQITASIERDSRAAGVEDTEFKEGESIGIYICKYSSTEETPLDCHVATYTNGKWKFEHPVYVDEDSYIFAVYPADCGSASAPSYNFFRNGEKLKAGVNHLGCDADVKDTYPVTNLIFRHIMARVQFEITNPNAKPLSNIEITGDHIYKTRFKSFYLPNDESIGDRIYKEVITIENPSPSPNNVQTIDALLIPGSSGFASITLNYDDTESYKTDVRLPELEAGAFYHCPITIGDNTVSPEPSDDESMSFEVNGVKFKMIRVEAGTFDMGSSISSRDEDNPVHSVSISKDYYIAETEVTQALWTAVGYKSDAYYFGSGYGFGEEYPVYGIEFDDIKGFIEELSKKTGQVFRLPTEAEWEYAARGGNKSKGYKYSGSDNYRKVAWFQMNSNFTHSRVKSKDPNELGIYDMSGNVAEVCSDWYDPTYYSISPSVDPKGPETGTSLVIRGGDSLNPDCWTTRRGSNSSTRYLNYGFRLALSPSE